MIYGGSTENQHAHHKDALCDSIMLPLSHVVSLLECVSIIALGRKYVDVRTSDLRVADEQAVEIGSSSSESERTSV